MSDIFEQSKVIFSSFKGLETAYLQQKYFRNSFNMIDPISITLGSATQWKWRSPKRRCVSIEEKMVYIPLLLTLKQLTNLAKAELGSVGLCTDVLTDYCDSVSFKSHPLFSVHHMCLQFFLYYDDIEFCHPLGSKKHKHKLGVYYYSIGTLRPVYRSRIHQIQLVALVKRSYVNK